MLIALAQLLNYVFTYNGLENALVAELYKKPALWKLPELKSLEGHKLHVIDGSK